MQYARTQAERYEDANIDDLVSDLNTNVWANNSDFGEQYEAAQALFTDVIPDIISLCMNEQSNLSADDNPPSVSTTFNPATHLIPSAHPDVVLQSTDGVLFYVHYDILSKVSSNGFGGLLNNAQTNTAPTAVNDESTVLNIILHAVYSLPSVQFSTPFATLVIALDQMELVYGIPPKRFIVPSVACDLHAQLYSHIPFYPMDVFMLAAHHGLEDLAVLASGHLLSFRLETLTDEMAERMGPRYLKRLVFMHLGRITKLKEILGVPPPTHGGAGCTVDSQSAWALAAASLVDDAKPDLSPQLLVASMERFAKDISCATCLHNFRHRLSDAAKAWSNVRATI